MGRNRPPPPAGRQRIGPFGPLPWLAWAFNHEERITPHEHPHHSVPDDRDRACGVHPLCRIVLEACLCYACCVDSDLAHLHTTWWIGSLSCVVLAVSSFLVLVARVAARPALVLGVGTSEAARASSVRLEVTRPRRAQTVKAASAASARRAWP